MFIKNGIGLYSFVSLDVPLPTSPFSLSSTIL
nr:MAG TPA: hypothetical protein [Caudoviricetes sp.]